MKAKNHQNKKYIIFARYKKDRVSFMKYIVLFISFFCLLNYYSAMPAAENFSNGSSEQVMEKSIRFCSNAHHELESESAFSDESSTYLWGYSYINHAENPIRIFHGHTSSILRLYTAYKVLQSKLIAKRIAINQADSLICIKKLFNSSVTPSWDKAVTHYVFGLRKILI